MAKPFLNVRYHVAEKTEKELQPVMAHPRAMRGAAAPGRAAVPNTQFESDEAAARFFLGKVLEQDKRPIVRGLTAPQRPELVPDMRLQSVQNSNLTKTRLVRFEQTQSAIPVFGSQVVVELDADRKLVAVDAELARIQQISPLASITPQEAVQSIAKLTKASLNNVSLEAPSLTLFHDNKKDAWHLAWSVRKVPAAPPKFLKETSTQKSHGHGLGMSPRQHSPKLNYLVDAHSGKVLYYYSAAPMVSICKGLDELDAAQEFYGLQVTGGYEMHDSFRALKTYDLKGKDITATVSFPKNPIRSQTADWAQTNKAAISAHIHAMKVYDFYKSVLMRDGIDDQGMDLVSVVNCTYRADQPPPEWHNAVWYENRMWYGQIKDANGVLRSYSRYMDVIAHELTHGITEFTSNLVYKDESGALNESFSDIFGVIINNWDATKPDATVANWKWEIGPGLGANALPLRDLSNPKRTGDPDHMDNYLETENDNGGVHSNSNIHNKAAYNVLTAKDLNGNYVFKPRDVAVLYYLCLQRLPSLATFAKTLQTLVDVTTTYYGGDAAERDRKIAHIREAYKNVGIE